MILKRKRVAARHTEGRDSGLPWPDEEGSFGCQSSVVASRGTVSRLCRGRMDNGVVAKSANFK